MKRWLHEQTSFALEFVRTFETTGSLVPSGRFLARAIMPRDIPSSPARILEIGPGTGSFTNELIARLRTDDHLTIVELNPRFVALLKDRLRSDERWSTRSGQVELIATSILDLAPARGYDSIVCGLPFSNFQPSLARQIFDHCWSLLAPGGEMAFFEYFALRKVKGFFVPAPERRRLVEIGSILAEFLSRGESAEQVVWPNVPPAVVHRLVKTTSSNGR